MAAALYLQALSSRLPSKAVREQDRIAAHERQGRLTPGLDARAGLEVQPWPRTLP